MTAAEVASIGVVSDVDRQEYDSVCAVLLVESDYQQVGRDKSFKKRSAWRILANHYGLSCSVVSRDYERATDGRTILRAEVVDRATGLDGRTMEGIGACDAFERCCKQPCWRARYDDHTCCDDLDEPCSGVRHFTHAEHDIRATAATRARNRAIADLIGFGEVSAEELVGEGEPVPDTAMPDDDRPPVAAVGEPNADSVWLDVLGAPAEWEDLRARKVDPHDKAKTTWPDFRALPTNERWGTSGQRDGKPAPMALWLDGHEPDGFIEVLAMRDQGLTPDPELLDLESMVVERVKPYEKWKKGELAQELEDVHGIKLGVNELARMPKPQLITRLREAEAARDAKVSEPGESGDREEPGGDLSPDSSPGSASLPECALCGSAKYARTIDPSGARCKDSKGCMRRMEAAAADASFEDDAA